MKILLLLLLLLVYYILPLDPPTGSRVFCIWRRLWKWTRTLSSKAAFPSSPTKTIIGKKLQEQLWIGSLEDIFSVLFFSRSRSPSGGGGSSRSSSSSSSRSSSSSSSGTGGSISSIAVVVVIIAVIGIEEVAMVVVDVVVTKLRLKKY